MVPRSIPTAAPLAAILFDFECSTLNWGIDWIQTCSAVWTLFVTVSQKFKEFNRWTIYMCVCFWNWLFYIIELCLNFNDYKARDNLQTTLVNLVCWRRIILKITKIHVVPESLNAVTKSHSTMCVKGAWYLRWWLPKITIKWKNTCKTGSWQDIKVISF